jgi:GntR family transcriptional repressor for pyruvate dehydrogenase complex
MPQRTTRDEFGRVIAELVQYIRKRGFEPGERIASERDLAERFGVGRGLVREALSVLESMRIVERRPNSGIYLRQVDAEGSLDAVVLFHDLGIPASNDEVLQLVEMRRMLEVQTIALAAARWEPDDLQALERVLEQAERRLARGESIVEEDAAFHLGVVACAHNQFIKRVAHSYYLASHHRRIRYFAAPEQCRASHDEHLALFAALQARDSALASARMEYHLVGMKSYWMDRLEFLPASEESTATAARQP